jgi:hypothetical protein
MPSMDKPMQLRKHEHADSAIVQEATRLHLGGAMEGAPSALRVMGIDRHSINDLTVDRT